MLSVIEHNLFFLISYYSEEIKCGIPNQNDIVSMLYPMLNALHTKMKNLHHNLLSFLFLFVFGNPCQRNIQGVCNNPYKLC